MCKSAQTTRQLLCPPRPAPNFISLISGFHSSISLTANLSLLLYDQFLHVSKPTHQLFYQALHSSPDLFTNRFISVSLTFSPSFAVTAVFRGHQEGKKAKPRNLDICYLSETAQNLLGSFFPTGAVFTLDTVQALARVSSFP